MYQVTYTLPESKRTKTQLLKIDQNQAELYRIIEKNFRELQCEKQETFYMRKEPDELNFNIKCKSPLFPTGLN